MNFKILSTNRGNKSILYVKDIFIDFCQLLNMVKIHGVVTKSVVSVPLATDMENSCIINVKNEHNHEPDERKAERQQLRCNAKRKASEDATARPSKIIGKQLQTMSKTNLKQDDIKNVSKAIDRERRKRHTTLPVTVKCCRFHLGQSWWRKIQSLGLSNEYKDKESDIGKWLLMTFGLHFVSSDRIEDIFAEVIMSETPSDSRCTSYADYRTVNYITQRVKISTKYLDRASI